jgi:hypothetical protein
MPNFIVFIFGVIILVFFSFISCSENEKSSKFTEHKKMVESQNKMVDDTIITDCNYTFEDATAGSKAPIEIINQLKLISVRYYSTDGKIHKGQILTNEKLVENINQIFDFIYKEQFPISKAIPIVKYDWNDNLSMNSNNTYSFCYRNTSYSKHAVGMAIDINPYFNPLRWKNEYKYRANKPAEAVYDTTISGTLYPSHPVVLEFKKLGFRWGHSFTRNYDDQHFEK